MSERGRGGEAEGEGEGGGRLVSWREETDWVRREQERGWGERKEKLIVLFYYQITDFELLRMCTSLCL